MTTTPIAAFAAAAALTAGVLSTAATAWAADAPTTSNPQAQPVQKVTVKAVAHFGFDASAIDPQDEARLLAEVGEMKDVTWQTVTATGHTDSVGSAAYNQSLAQRRAAAVKTYLLGKGLPTTLVRTAAKGEDAPVADNNTDEGRAQNRRTEVVFEGVRAK